MKFLRLLLCALCVLCGKIVLAQRLMDAVTLGGANYLKNAATFTVQSGGTLTIASGGSLVVASGATFTVPAGTFELPLTFSTPLARATNTISIANAAADGSTKGAATFTAADFNASSGLISLDYTNGQAATGSVKGYLTAADWTTFNAKESALTFSSPLSRSVNTISIANAAADGSTKGAAAFAANDFDASSGVISLDYTNGQAASGSNKGFLSSTDWTTFNTKISPPGSPALGDILYYNGSAWTRFARGADGYVLKANATTIVWAAEAAGGSVATSTSTGTQNDFDFSGASLLRMNNATATTLTGLLAGTAGQRLTIVSVGAGQVNLTNQDTGSTTAGDRIINPVTGTIALAAGTGSAELVYDGTTARWRVVGHRQGAPIAVAYSGGNFTGSGSLTWTVASGDQVTYCYVLQGRVLTVYLVLDTTTVSGSGAALQVAIPGGLSASQQMYQAVAIADNSTFSTGLIQVVSGTTIYIYRNIAGTNWSAATDTTYVRGSISFDVQ